MESVKEEKHDATQMITNPRMLPNGKLGIEKRSIILTSILEKITERILRNHILGVPQVKVTHSGISAQPEEARKRTTEYVTGCQE